MIKFSVRLTHRLSRLCPQIYSNSSRLNDRSYHHPIIWWRGTVHKNVKLHVKIQPRIWDLDFIIRLHSLSTTILFYFSIKKRNRKLIEFCCLKRCPYQLFPKHEKLSSTMTVPNAPKCNYRNVPLNFPINLQLNKWKAI